MISSVAPVVPYPWNMTTSGAGDDGPPPSHEAGTCSVYGRSATMAAASMGGGAASGTEVSSVGEASALGRFASTEASLEGAGAVLGVLEEQAVTRRRAGSPKQKRKGIEN